MTPDGDEIGKVAKQFSGVARELITDADNFSVSFPLDLDVKIKAVLFGAVFLIDMMFFEDTNDGSEQIGINNWKNKYLKNKCWKMNLKQLDCQTEIKSFLVRRKLYKVCYTVR